MRRVKESRINYIHIGTCIFDNVKWDNIPKQVCKKNLVEV